MTEPGRLEQGDLLDALGAAVIADPQDPASLRELVTAAKTELKRRFEEEPESLPGTFVIKMVLDGEKQLNARDAPSELPEVTILDRIDALPAEHGIALLRGEITRLTSLTETYTETLIRLEEGA